MTACRATPRAVPVFVAWLIRHGISVLLRLKVVCSPLEVTGEILGTCLTVLLG